MNKEEVKIAVKKAVVLIAASVACMSLFACGTKTKYENPNQKYLNKGESMDGKITGRTRIENGLVMEWQEDFPMDKTMVPTRIEYKETYHSMIYNIDGVEITVVTDANGRNFTTDPTNVRAEFATITDGVNKSNEQVLKSVAANKALNKAMQKKTK